MCILIRRLSPLFLIVLLTMSASGQRQRDACLTVEGGSTHSLGSIHHRDRPEHDFILRNNCADTVFVTKVQAGCSCTPTSISTNSIAPGETARLSVRFVAPRSTVGRINKAVSVYTEGDSRRQYVLRMEADIQSFFSVSPDPVEPGAMTLHNTATATVRLTNISGEQQQITDVEGALSVEYRGADGSSHPQMLPIDKVEVTPKEFTLAPQETQEIRVQFVPRHEGQLRGSLRMHGHDETRQVEFTGTISRP